MELEKLTALQLADKIKKHEVSVLDSVKDVFSKIEEKDNRIHAYLDTYKKEAYARAKRWKKALRTELIPVLLPVFPLLSKITFSVQGKPTTCASKFWKDLFPSIRQR